jgi:hypothetical protein
MQAIITHIHKITTTLKTLQDFGSEKFLTV